MRCPRCGELLDVDRGRCPRCDATTRRPGLLARLFRALLTRGKSRTVATHVRTRPAHETMHVSERIVWQDESGARREWNRWEDVPPDIRAKMESMRGDVMSSEDAVVTNAAGSIDDLPPDVRQRILRMTGGRVPDHVTIESTRDIDYVIEDESGERRTYESLDDMPPEVRARFEQALREHGEP